MKNKIKQLLKNKDVKSLIENFFSLGALQVINLILPLVVLPYMIKTVGFNKYGVVVLAASLIAYFSSVTDYSFTITATRDVAVFRDSPQKINIIYSKVLIVKSILLLFSWLIIGIIVFAYLPFYEEKTVFFCSALMLFGYVLFPEWFFQGIEKMKFIAFLNVGIKVFFTACIFILVRTPEDYWKYALLNSIGYIGAGLIGQYLLIKKYKLKFIWLKKKYIRQTFKSNFPVFVNQFVPTLFNNTSIFLMGIMVNTYTIGVFDAIKKIIMLESVFIQIVSRVFFPYLNRNKQYFKKFAKISMFCFALVIGLVLISHPIFFNIFNIHDDLAFTVLIILSIGILFIGFYSIYSTNFLLVHRADKTVMSITIFSSLIGFVSAYPMIHFLGMVGGALNIMFCQILLGTLAFVYYKKYSRTLK